MVYSYFHHFLLMKGLINENLNITFAYFEIDFTNRYMIMNVVDCEINSLVIDMFRNFLRLFPSRYMKGPHKSWESYFDICRKCIDTNGPQRYHLNIVVSPFNSRSRSVSDSRPRDMSVTHGYSSQRLPQNVSEMKWVPLKYRSKQIFKRKSFIWNAAEKLFFA